MIHSLANHSTVIKINQQIQNHKLNPELFQTEGIKYAGSKLKIIPHIIEMVSGLQATNVLDGFSGSTRVSQAFAKFGFNTVSSDISVWSATFAKAYLLNRQPDKYYEPILQHLNSLKGYEGWFTEYYGGVPGKKDKRPFQEKNTKKLDAIRDELETLSLSEVEKSVLLTSLILALDAVDNTLGHYAAYLSKWSARSFNNLHLKLPKLINTEGAHEVIRGDIFDTIRNKSFDLAYFDPPYGSNNEKMPPSRVRYHAYYHIWTSVILHDRAPLFGKAWRREDSRDSSSSVFEEFRKDENGKYMAMNAIRDLIAGTNARYILLSYSSGGRATKQDLFDIIESSGKLIYAKEINYRKNVMANMRWTNDWVGKDEPYLEYLFLMEKT